MVTEIEDQNFEADRFGSEVSSLSRTLLQSLTEAAYTDHSYLTILILRKEKEYLHGESSRRTCVGCWDGRGVVCNVKRNRCGFNFLVFSMKG